LNKNLFFIQIIGFLSAFSLSSQQLTGHVVDSEGQPVSNASVYIREISLGLVADDNGNFRTRIEEGDYTLEISSVGFEKKIILVSVSEKGLDLQLEMQDKIYELQEVTVTKDDKDLAGRIMRNVIARTPYFYRQLKNYESDVYLKGTFKIEKIPKFITLTAGSKNKELNLLVGNLFILESQNKVKYTQPNKYEQHVIAMKSSIPADLDINDNVPLSMVTNNIYAPGTFGGLLSPSAFSVYKFSLENAYSENEHTIYKIKIIPRKKNRKLVGGYLDIVDNTWNIRRAYIVQNELSGMTASYNLTYNEVKPGAFLPVSYDMSMNIDLMGLKGYGKFYSSIQYTNVETNNHLDMGIGNQTLKQPEVETALNPSAGGEPARKKQSAKDFRKLQEDLNKLEELSEKEKLTIREARQMAKLITQTTETDEEREQKRKLEIIPLDSFIFVTKDTLALLRDSAFWEITRKVPLDDEELQSYIIRDSLKTATDSIKKADSADNKKANSRLKAILFGNDIKVNRKFSINFAGIPKICPEYNFVDGFWLGQKLTLICNYNGNSRITLTPSVYYATARKTAIWQVNVSLAYLPLHNGHLCFSSGNESADYAGSNGTNRFVNSVASLVFAENTAKFYQRKFIFVSNYIDMANGLRFDRKFYYAKRSELYNNTSYNFFGRTPNVNSYSDIEGRMYAVMPPHNTFSTYMSLQYTPRYYYYVREGRKYYSHSAYPTFLLGYERAFPGNDAVNSSYERLELTISQQVKTDIFSNISYFINAGIYLNSKTVYLPDYKHFNTSELFITDKFLYNSFVLADNYMYATNEKWLQAHIAYNSDYLLVKRLPFLQNYLFSEDFHLKTLFLSGKNHSEIGYSTGLGNAGRIGVFVGFNNWKYKNTGIIISLPIANNF
jgi:hypothetical protein